jgi:hypothetical protein
MESARLRKKAKLGIDFLARLGLRLREEAQMDDDLRDLIGALCTRVGMLMEDASVVALGMALAKADQMPDQLSELDRSTRAMISLIAAAQTLVLTKPN